MFRELARMAVPKLVNNGHNSIFCFLSYVLCPFTVHALKRESKAESRLKTIFNHFGNTHARSFFSFTSTSTKTLEVLCIQHCLQLLLQLPLLLLFVLWNKLVLVVPFQKKPEKGRKTSINHTK
jgi:hypothetical protein